MSQLHPAMKHHCLRSNVFTQETMTLESEEVKIRRPEQAGQVVMSLEVDRQRNRLQAAEAMAQARLAAEQGDLSSVGCRKMLAETIGLDAELKEMQERIASRHLGERTSFPD
ncbi:hypothetical protein S83_023254 [Arachis hypogaea]